MAHAERQSDATRAGTPGLGEELASDAYLRVRRRPGRRDGDYLSLSDLNRWIERQAAEFGGDVFDYGCGGAPYADLFARCRRYVRADVVAGPRVDRLLGEDGLTGEPEASYDWVFSTQVLEHVPEPAKYLAECRRILRPGGHLVLSTHGFYPEHGCPQDFHRWTGEGLAREARGAGLEVRECVKLTTGVRGAVQMLHHCVWGLRTEGGGLAGVALGVLRKTYGGLGVPVLNALADRFAAQGEAASVSATALYVGVAIRARRPVV